MADLRQRIDAARANLEALERQALKATCAELGCDMRHIGGANAGCEDECCSCSVPVHECSRCGDCDYGDNDEANQVRADCAMRRGDG